MKISPIFEKWNFSKKSENLNEKKSKNFSFQNFATRFSKNLVGKNLAIAFIYALIFSMPIYINIFTYLSIENRQISTYFPYINTIFALFAVASAISVDRKYRFFFGFFVGIMWFYWTNLSFRFTPSPCLMWIGIVVVAFVYGVVFYFLLFFNNKFWRIIALSIIGYIPIFGFDWLVIESLFAFSVLRVDKISFVFILFCVAMCLHFLQKMRESKNNGKLNKAKRHFKKAILALILLIFVIDFSNVDVEIPKNIFISETHLDQSEKWRLLENAVNTNFRLIDEAISRGDKTIILPETAFPLRINMHSWLMDQLLELSHKITIITGARRYGDDSSIGDDSNIYNSTFVFEKGQWQYADKIFLAPFGEYAPIPKMLAEVFGKIFDINIARGFAKSKNLTNDLSTELFSFRAAICYEATTRKAFSGNPQMMIVIGNSAWFEPSIEPILQMMIIKYYARIHKTLVIHSTNASKSMIVTPNVSLKFVGRD